MRPGTTSCRPGATTKRAPVDSMARMTVTMASGSTAPTVMTVSMCSARMVRRRAGASPMGAAPLRHEAEER